MAKEPNTVIGSREARSNFAELILLVFGPKRVFGIRRHGRMLGALVPGEALLMLAGRADEVDSDIRIRIEEAAQAALKALDEAQR